MKKLVLAGAALAATMTEMGNIRSVSPPPPEKPKRKTKAKKTKHKARPRARDYANPYSRSIYVPGGAERNCGDRGISPKLLERHHG